MPADVYVLDFLDITITNSLDVVACSYRLKSANVVAHDLTSFAITVSSKQS